MHGIRIYGRKQYSKYILGKYKKGHVGTHVGRIDIECTNPQGLSSFIGIPRAFLEDWVSFVRRRSKISMWSEAWAKVGMWSEAWARQTISWHEHIMRGGGVLRDLFLWSLPGPVCGLGRLC